MNPPPMPRTPPPPLPRQTIPNVYYSPPKPRSILAPLVIAFAALFTIWLFLADMEMDNAPAGDRAAGAARAIILGAMKDPKAEIDLRSVGWNPRLDGRFEAWGKVRGKNGFGVDRLENWAAVIERVDGEQWAAVWIKIGDQESGTRPPDKSD